MTRDQVRRALAAIEAGDKPPLFQGDVRRQRVTQFFRGGDGPLLIYRTVEEWLQKTPAMFDGCGPDGTWAWPWTSQHHNLPGYW